MSVTLEAVKQDVDDLKEVVRRLELIITGNGKLGLAARVEIIWRSWVLLLSGLASIVGFLLGKSGIF